MSQTASTTTGRTIERAENVLPRLYDPAILGRVEDAPIDLEDPRHPTRVFRAARRAILGGLALAAIAGLTVPAPHAAADVIRPRQTITATITGPTTTITAQVATSAPMPGTRGRLYCATVTGPALQAASCATTPTVTITATLPSSSLTVGASTVQVTDNATGDTAPVRLEVRRLALLDPIHVTRTSPGRVIVCGSTYAVTPSGIGYLASVRVPVQIQRYDGRTWHTITTATSDPWGGFAAQVPAARGSILRAVRSQATLSTSATSAAVTTR